MKSSFRSVALTTMIAVLILSACAQAAPTPFIPPTRVLAPPTQVTRIAFTTQEPAIPTEEPTATLEPENSPTPLPPTATPTCYNDLQFVEDITLPDGVVVLPGQTLDKQWRVQNSGSCNWDSRYSLRLLYGEVYGTETELPLYPALSGTTAVLQVAMTAPQFPGVYRTDWQAYDAEGNPFGQPIYMEIVIGNP